MTSPRPSPPSPTLSRRCPAGHTGPAPAHPYPPPWRPCPAPRPCRAACREMEFLPAAATAAAPAAGLQVPWCTALPAAGAAASGRGAARCLLGDVVFWRQPQEAPGRRGTTTPVGLCAAAAGAVPGSGGCARRSFGVFLSRFVSV